MVISKKNINDILVVYDVTIDFPVFTGSKAL